MNRRLYSLMALFVVLTSTVKADTIPNISSIISANPARCIGPGGSRGNGRIADIAVYDNNPDLMYVGTASGGVFKTINGGRTFTAVFDSAECSAIGAIGIQQRDTNIVWIGTGEAWHRNDAGIGDGVYKSTDGGKSWQHMGLPRSGSICKIVIHPTNANIVYVGVTGHAWVPNEYRGVYKTINGGKTWEKVLYFDPNSGVADLVMDPSNPNVLMASLWDHQRLPYHYRHAGKGSGIYKTKDGGKTWYKLTKGIPAAEKGRISLAYFPGNPKYAATFIEVSKPATGFYTSSDGGETWTEQPAVHYRDNKIAEGNQWSRPFYNNLIRFDPHDRKKIYYGNPGHFTADGGKSFVGAASDDHGLWIDPANSRHMVYTGDGGLELTWSAGLSKDSWSESLTKANMPPFGQFYGIGYDMRKLYHIMGNEQDNVASAIPTQSSFGIDKGIVTAVNILSLPGGEGSTSKSDPSDWTTLYSGDRGGALFRYDVKTRATTNISPYKFFDDKGWNHYSGTPEANKVYMESKYHGRASWFAPFIISPHDHNTIYHGGNYLFKSIDRGEHWTIISPDLSHNKPEWQIPNPDMLGRANISGSEIYQTIYTISESPLRKGLIWVGTDDGKIQLTTDDGRNWTDLTSRLPQVPAYTWVTRIQASNHVEQRAYLTMDGRRNGDFTTYVFMTEDMGKTWVPIKSNLPSKLSCHVIREGLKNPDLLILGTENSLWISLDRGRQWARYRDWSIAPQNAAMRSSGNSTPDKGYLPTVPVYDMEIHPRELDLILGTHGRSIWTMPIRSLESLTKENLAKPVFFIEPGPIYLFQTANNAFMENSEIFWKNLVAGNYAVNTQPGTFFQYYLKEAAAGIAEIMVYDKAGAIVHRSEGTTKAGLNTVQWLAGNGSALQPGNYRVELKIGSEKYEQTLRVEEVPKEELQY